jgi:hypothetical protein
MASDSFLREARNLFTSFLKKNGYSAWHVLDGWVKSEYYVTVDLSRDENLRLVWIDDNVERHSFVCPHVGEKIVIVNKSLSGNEFEPFDIFCYEVIRNDCPVRPNKILILKKLDIKKAIYDNGQYDFYLPNKEGDSFLTYIFKKIGL